MKKLLTRLVLPSPVRMSKLISLPKNLLFLIALLPGAIRLHAQNLNAYTTALAGTVTFGPPISGNSTKTEVPPWIIAGGWRSYFFVDGINSYVGSSPLDMINNNVIVPAAGPYTTTSPDGCTAANMFPWRRNYYAVYSAQYFNHPTQGTVSLGFLHGENTSVIGVHQPLVSCQGIGWPSYAGFVCGSWIPNTQATNWGQQYFANDLGAIVWPSTGYFLPNGQKSSLGVRHPTSIQADDGYMYVFYKDQSHYVVPSYGTPGTSGYYAGDPDFPLEDGRHAGIKVARAPISDALNPQAYMSFYEDAGGVHWNPSLPAGFTKELTTTYLYVQGPQASNIMGIETEGHYDYNRFSVAKVNGTNYYFGVASYQDYDDPYGYDANGHPLPKLKVSLRYSYDLVHWQGNLVIDVSNDWTTSHFNYPIFLSTNGWSNNAIDPNDFYVIGTSPSTINHTVYRMHVYIPAPPPPPPPPPPPCKPVPNGPVCPVQPESQSNMAAALAAVLDDSEGGAPYVYPNPGHGVYTLSYTLKDHAITQLNVLDVTGRVLQAGSTSMRGPGRYTESVNITSRAKGVYLLELLVNGGRKTFKVVYL